MNPRIPQNESADWLARQLEIREREYELARELAQAALMHLERVLGRPYDNKIRLNHIARLAALATRLSRLATGLPACSDRPPGRPGLPRTR
jgi:hypothetical protein